MPELIPQILTSDAIVGRAGQHPSAYQVVEAWHADAGHVGRFGHCTEQPCHAIRRAGAL